MDNKYVKDYYNLERQHWWFVVRNKLLMDVIKTRINTEGHLNILNIGAGSGRTSELLEEIGTVTTVEPDPYFYQFLSQNLNHKVIKASITSLPFNDESFHLVCAFDVLEHVENDQLAVNEIFRVCRKNGFVFISVPAFNFLWSSHDEINHHYRRYRLKEIKKLFFQTQECKKIYATYFNTLLFFPVAVFRLISRAISFKYRKSNSGSDFEAFKTSTFANKFFYLIFSMERRLLKYMKFPLGISGLSVFKKTKNEDK